MNTYSSLTLYFSGILFLPPTGWFSVNSAYRVTGQAMEELQHGESSNQQQSFLEEYLEASCAE